MKTGSNRPASKGEREVRMRGKFRKERESGTKKYLFTGILHKRLVLGNFSHLLPRLCLSSAPDRLQINAMLPFTPSLPRRVWVPLYRHALSADKMPMPFFLLLLLIDRSVLETHVILDLMYLLFSKGFLHRHKYPIYFFMLTS